MPARRRKPGDCPGVQRGDGAYTLDPKGHIMEMITDPRQKIEDVLESIRPALRSDGGDVEFIDFDEDDGIVQLRLVGACGSCPVSTMTLKQGIERRLMMAVPEVRGIIAL
jgi:Fe-S cluster biogenesis protein NfuA